MTTTIKKILASPDFAARFYGIEENWLYILKH